MSCDVGEATKGWRMRQSCDVGKAAERLENEVGEVSMTEVKQRNGCRTSCDVGEATKGWRMRQSYVGKAAEGLEDKL